MKKLVLIVSTVFLTGLTYSQKADRTNPFSLEGILKVSKDGINWYAPNLRARYFLKDNMAAKFTLGYTHYKLNDINLFRTYNVGMGYEYHLPGTDRLSPYFLGGVSFGQTKSKNVTIIENTINLGFGIGAGVDYYIAKNIYIGVEFGLNFTLSENTAFDADPSKTSSIGGGSSIRMGWRF